MEIMEFGNPEDRCLILIHGFESPWQIWKPYVEAYRDQFYILVPILPGHNPGRKERFDSFDECARELRGVEELYKQVTGKDLDPYYRPPQGIFSRENLKMDRLIFSSSPVCAWNPTFTKLMQRQYLRLTHRAQRGDKKVLQQAVGLNTLESLFFIPVKFSHKSVNSCSFICNKTDRNMVWYIL